MSNTSSRDTTPEQETARHSIDTTRTPRATTINKDQLYRDYYYKNSYDPIDEYRKNVPGSDRMETIISQNPDSTPSALLTIKHTAQDDARVMAYLNGTFRETKKRDLSLFSLNDNTATFIADRGASRKRRLISGRQIKEEGGARSRSTTQSRESKEDPYAAIPIFRNRRARVDDTDSSMSDAESNDIGAPPSYAITGRMEPYLDGREGGMFVVRADSTLGPRDRAKLFGLIDDQEFADAISTKPYDQWNTLVGVMRRGPEGYQSSSNENINNEIFVIRGKHAITSESKLNELKSMITTFDAEEREAAEKELERAVLEELEEQRRLDEELASIEIVEGAEQIVSFMYDDDADKTEKTIMGRSNLHPTILSLTRTVDDQGRRQVIIHSNDTNRTWALQETISMTSHPTAAETLPEVFSTPGPVPLVYEHSQQDVVPPAMPARALPMTSPPSSHGFVQHQSSSIRSTTSPDPSEGGAKVQSSSSNQTLYSALTNGGFPTSPVDRVL